MGPGFHEQVYALVQQVPPGQVTTYGAVAAALGLRSVARHVGYALAALPADRRDVPWQRVVTASGRLSLRADGRPSAEQLARLRAEGLEVREDGRIAAFRAHLFRFPVRRS